MLITNDAWMGTGHMSDVCVLKPIFHRDRLVAFSATTAHMPDIGGRVRAIEAREVFEEGLHIPLAKLVHAGRTDDTLVAAHPRQRAHAGHDHGRHLGPGRRQRADGAPRAAR